METTTVFCPSCGSESPEGSATCPGCGKTDEEVGREVKGIQGVYCPGCGKQLPKESRYCADCGTTVSDLPSWARWK